LRFPLRRSRGWIDEGRLLGDLLWTFSLELFQSLNLRRPDALQGFHHFLVPTIPFAACSSSTLLKLVRVARNWQAHWDVTVGI
jgi:hypothetical protein